MTTDENPGWALRWMRENYAALLITEDPTRVRLVTNPHDDGLSYYQLPDGRRFPVPTDPRTLIWSDHPEDQGVLPRRAEQMIDVNGVASAQTANDYARRLISEHLGQDAVDGFEEADISTRLEYGPDGGVVQVYETPDGESVTVPIYGVGFRSDPEAAPLEEGAMQELARFEWTIQNLDPADSAWNPVTGLEPVLCRVCGNSSDPRTGKVLEHRDRYPCTPRVETATPDGGTTQVRDLVLLRSANMREELAATRDELTPEEVLEVSVRAFVDAGFRGIQNVPAGPVRECLRCLAISQAPGWVTQHGDHRCAGSDGYVVAVVDPNELDVAAIHLPGAKSITDPAWVHLEAGWWVALEGTPDPGWAETYHEAVPLLKVAHWAIKPTDLTPVRLTGPDREHSRDMAGHLTQLAEYFRMLDRPETVHGITTLTQAIGTAVRQSWDALQALHGEDGGNLIHAGLGTTTRCPLCSPRDSEATERRMERLAETVHARMAGEVQTRTLTVREVWVILDHLLAYRAWEDPGASYFTLAEVVANQINNRHLVRQVTGVQRQIFTADVASVVRSYRRHLAAGGDRGPVRPVTP